jgi:hypothetical protein
MPKGTEQCVRCHFWIPQQSHKKDADPASCLGDCHRNAPQVDPNKGKYVVYWPGTRGNEWCGEYKEESEGAEFGHSNHMAR